MVNGISARFPAWTREGECVPAALDAYAHLLRTIKGQVQKNHQRPSGYVDAVKGEKQTIACGLIFRSRYAELCRGPDACDLNY